MNNSTTTGAPAPGSASNWRGVPRAAWIAGGALAIAAAAMAGALITRSIDAPSAPPATSSAPIAPMSQIAPEDGVRPVPLTAQAPVPAPAAAPAVPAPAPAAVQPVPRAVAQRSAPAPARAVAPAVCATCGVVESVATVKVKGEGTGIGAAAGGVLGGVAGNQIGGGSGKTAMTVLGAIGGGFAGHEVEKRARGETRYEVRVRMDNGNLRTFERDQAIAVGTPVTVNGANLRVGARNNG